jgi:hypothetical protein
MGTATNSPCESRYPDWEDILELPEVFEADVFFFFNESLCILAEGVLGVDAESCPLKISSRSIDLSKTFTAASGILDPLARPVDLW